MGGGERSALSMDRQVTHPRGKFQGVPRGNFFFSPMCQVFRRRADENAFFCAIAAAAERHRFALALTQS